MTVISGKRRNSYPGDPVYIMQRTVIADDGYKYYSGTEYTPLWAGIDNTRRGAPAVQRVIIGGEEVEFVGHD